MGGWGWALRWALCGGPPSPLAPFLWPLWGRRCLRRWPSPLAAVVLASVDCIPWAAPGAARLSSTAGFKCRNCAWTGGHGVDSLYSQLHCHAPNFARR